MFLVRVWLFLVSLLVIGYAFWYTQRMESEGWNLLSYPAPGTQVGTFESEPIYATGGISVRGEFGLKFQCVEFIRPVPI